MEGVEDGEKMVISTGSCTDETHHQPSNYREGGLRTMPFIIVNESFERLASVGLSPNMVFYLRDSYGLQIAAATSILSLWGSASNALAIVGAVLADSYLGRFRTIIIGSFCSFFGMAILWLTAMIPQLKPLSCTLPGTLCNSANANAYQFIVLVSSLVLMSMGAGCIRPCSIAFGADQLTNKGSPNSQSVLDTYFNWYYASTGVASVIALTLLVYIQDHFGYKTGFAVPAFLMFFSVVAFLMGSSLYVKVKPAESLLMGFVQVIVVAFKNRSLTLPQSNFDQYYLGCDPKFLVPSDDMRCLNKACLIYDAENNINSDGSVSNPWNLCSVDQVESFKGFLRVIPIWSTCIFMIVCLNQNTFSTLQAEIMNKHITSSFAIPAGSMTVFMVLSVCLWIAIYDRIIVPLLTRCGKAGGLSPKVRIGIGLLLSCLAMAISAVVEGIRRRSAIEEGLEDQPRSASNMSALWIVPQSIVMGVAEGFSAVGQIELFYSQFPKTMSSVAVSLYTLEMAVAGLVGSILVQIVNGITGGGNKISWLDNNLNKGHLDYFYWLCAVLGFICFFGYIVYCWTSSVSFENRGTQKVNASNGVEEEFEYDNLPSS